MSVDVCLADAAWEGVDANVQALLDRWLAAPGAALKAGDAVASVVLVKSTLEVTAPVAGRLAEILVPAGENFARGQPLARITPASG